MFFGAIVIGCDSAGGRRHGCWWIGRPVVGLVAAPALQGSSRSRQRRGREQDEVPTDDGMGWVLERGAERDMSCDTKTAQDRNVERQPAMAPGLWGR